MSDYPYLKSGVTDHGQLSGLNDDDHQQYVSNSGRSGGQTIYGGVNPSENLIIDSTMHVIKGNVLINTSGQSCGLSSHIGLGGVPGPTVPSIRRCSIDSSTGDIVVGNGTDIMLNSGNDTSPDQQFKALKVWASVYNDIADFQPLSPRQEKIIYGKCYRYANDGVILCDRHCQKGVIGIATDTFGLSIGQEQNVRQIPIAISGFVLAYVDRRYPAGTPLTNSACGDLTEITMDYKTKYPERIMAIYIRPENEEFWGPKNNQIKVDGRHWVKIV